MGLSLLVAESKDPSRSGRVDVVGALLSALGFGGVVFGLIEGRTYGWFTSLTPLTIGSWSWPWSLSPVPVAMVVGVAALVVFVLLERRKQRRGEAGMLDLALFAIPSFRNGNIAAAIVSLGEFGIIFALPLWLQNVIGYTAFETGLILLALAGGSFLASGLGAAIGRTRSPLFIVRLGIVLEILGIAGLAVFLRPDSTWVVVSAAPLRLRRGRRVRDGAADRRGPRRRPGRAERPGFRDAEHGPPGGFGARDRDPRHRPVPHPHQPVRQRPHGPRGPGGPAGPARRRRGVQRRRGDSRPGREPRAPPPSPRPRESAYTDATRLSALVGGRLPRHRTVASLSLGTPADVDRSMAQLINPSR